MATRSLGTLTLDLVAKIGGFTQGLDQAERTAKKRTKAIKQEFNAMKATFVAATAAAVAATAGLLKSALDEQEQLQRNMLRTEAIITATGAAAGFTAEQLHDQARGLALATLQSTEGVMRAQQILLTFKSVAGDTFTRTTELAADLATVTNTSLTSAMTQLGKALDDPERGLASLRKASVIFTKEQENLIKSLVETGDKAGAQKLILDEVARQYGGVARKEALGLAGAQDTLGQRIQEAKIALAEQLQLSDRVSGWYNSMADLVLTLGNNVDRIIVGFETAAVVIGTRYVAALGFAIAKKAVLITSTVAATGALTAMRTVLLTLAGPAGWIALAAGGAYAMSQAFDDSGEKARQMAKAVKGLTGELIGLSKTQLELKKIDLSEQLARQAVEIQGIGEKVAAARNKLRESIPMRGEGLIPDVGDIKINIEATVETQALKQQFGEATTAINATGKAIQEVDAALGRVNKLSVAAPGGDELNDLVTTTKTATDAIAETIKELEFQVATLGMSEEAIARYKLELAGATDAQLSYIDTLQGRLQADKELQDAIQREIEGEKELQRLYDQHIEVITGVDSSVLQYIDTLGELKQLLDAGKISWDEYTAAIRRAKPAYDEAATGADTFGELALEAAKRSQGAFADFLYDPFAEGLDGMAAGFTNTLRRMIAEAAAAEIFESLTKDAKNFSDVFANIFGSSGGGESGGSWLQSAGNFISGIFGGGRASGGPVMAGSFYEVGEFNKPELLRVNNKQYLIPGNDGAVEPMRGGGRRGGGTTVNQYISTPNANSFRDSDRQIARGIKRRLGL